MLIVDQRYETQIEVMKSKFIAILLPINSEEQFKDILKDIRKEHRKARHVVYAYRLGNGYKSNDDGEPKGTAGRPLLELLLKKDINNCALIVVRYFGGTKLGAGRLLRTYVQAGVNVINKLEMGNSSCKKMF